MRELIYYVASTLDGFIAREDGSLGDFPWDDRYGAELLRAYPETFPAHLREGEFSREEHKRFDAVLMGRKTYEVGLDAGFSNPYPTLDQYVFSRSYPESPDPNVEVVRHKAVDVVRDVKKEMGKAIWLCGGAELAATLLEAGLIDGLIIKLNPVLFGAGIPLFGQGIRPRVLDLRDSKVFESGHAILHYRVRAAC
ncbi:MAG TPA: dihydrofolate reductase family protein [Acidobacteriota bacterium]|nr:dihydrofolate reductase family protein [Acidobacteriota bacterium]